MRYRDKLSHWVCVYCSTNQSATTWCPSAFQCGSLRKYSSMPLVWRTGAISAVGIMAGIISWISLTTCDDNPDSVNASIGGTSQIRQPTFWRTHSRANASSCRSLAPKADCGWSTSRSWSSWACFSSKPIHLFESPTVHRVLMQTWNTAKASSASLPSNDIARFIWFHRWSTGPIILPDIVAPKEK